tara:strand:- start:813 stop:1163 length:351 start_codon:yes stop_codon:yes gene_type:complete
MENNPKLNEVLEAVENAVSKHTQKEKVTCFNESFQARTTYEPKEGRPTWGQESLQVGVSSHGGKPGMFRKAGKTIDIELGTRIWGGMELSIRMTAESALELAGLIASAYCQEIKES